MQEATSVATHSSLSDPTPKGRWHHVRSPNVPFWLTDLQGRVIGSEHAYCGANFYVFTTRSANKTCAYASDARGRIGLIAISALAPGWRPNELLLHAG